MATYVEQHTGGDATANASGMGALGSDGTNLRYISTDASGHVNVIVSGGSTITGTITANQGTSPWVVSASNVLSVGSITGPVTAGTGAAHMGKAQNAASAAGDTGFMLLAARNDSAGTSLSSANGLYSPIAVDNAGRLWVVGGHIDTGSFTTASNRVLTMAGVFDDTPPSAVGTGKTAGLRMSNNRNLYVTLRDAAGGEQGLNIDANHNLGTVLASGANAIGSVTQGTSPWVVSASNTVTVSASNVLSSNVTAAQSGAWNISAISGPVTPGTAAGSLGKAQNAASAAGDTGVMLLAARNDSAADSLASANRLYSPMGVDNAGRLWVVGGHVDTGAFTTASNRVMTMAGVFDDTPPSAVAAGKTAGLRMSNNRNLYTTLRDAAGNERGWNIDANGYGGVSVSGTVTVSASNTVTVSASNTLTVAAHAVTAAGSGTFLVSRQNALVTGVYDYISLATAATTDTYTYKSGGSGGTSQATVTITYTDSTKALISTVAKT